MMMMMMYIYAAVCALPSTYLAVCEALADEVLGISGHSRLGRKVHLVGLQGGGGGKLGW